MALYFGFVLVFCFIHDLKLTLCCVLVETLQMYLGEKGGELVIQGAGGKSRASHRCSKRGFQDCDGNGVFK